MSSPNEKKPDDDVIATYKCQRRIGKMKLIGTRRVTYLDMRRMYGVGAKIKPYYSDEEGEGSKGADLANKDEGSKNKRPVDVVSRDIAESGSVALIPENKEDLGRFGPAGVVSGKKRARSGSPVGDGGNGAMNDAPSN